MVAFFIAIVSIVILFVIDIFWCPAQTICVEITFPSRPVPGLDKEH